MNWWTLFCILVLLAPGMRARAQPPIPARSLAAAIHVEPGATCLSHAGVTAQVHSWLGRRELDSELVIVVAGDTRTPQAAEFRLKRNGTESVRRFEHLPLPCPEATAILGLAIALAIDARLLGEGFNPVPSTPRHTRLAVAFVGGSLLLARPSLGAAAGIDQDLSAWLRARLGLLVLSARGRELSGTRGVVDATAWTMQAQLCAGGRFGRSANFALCSGAALGTLCARGRGFVSSYAERSRLLFATAGVRLTWKLWIPWVIDLETLLPVTAPTILARSASGAELRVAPARIGVLMAIGPAWEF